MQEGGNNEDLIGCEIKIIDDFNKNVLYTAIWEGDVISTELTLGLHYSIEVSNLIGYVGTYTQSYLAQYGTRNAIFYFTLALGVYIESKDHLLYTASNWSNTKTVNSVVLLLNNHKYRIAPVNPSLNCCDYANATNPQSYVTCVFVSDSEFSTNDGSLLLINDFNGKTYTEQWMSYYSAISASTNNGYCGVYCKNYTFPDGSKGYWGSAGQIREIAQNYTNVRACFNKIGISDFNVGYSSSYGGAPYGRRHTWWIYDPNRTDAFAFRLYNYSEAMKSCVISDYE